MPLQRRTQPRLAKRLQVAVRVSPLVIAVAGVVGHAAGLRVPCLSGFVRDTAGHPVAHGDLDFYEAASGIKLTTPSDNTDAAGFYNVCVLPNIYRVTYAPPPGTRLLGKEVEGVDLRAEGGRELDVVLESGSILSGRVETADHAALGDVDVDVDQVGGSRIFTPNDKSDPSTGGYAVVVPNGVYRVRFTPPPGAHWQGAQFEPMTMAGDRAQDVTLQPGFLIAGRITDETGTGLPGVDLDLRRVGTGEKIFVANRTTNQQGDVLATVPAGLFEVRFVPPRGSRSVAARLDSVEVGADLQLDHRLTSGVLVTAVVLDSTGAPVAHADLDAVLLPSREQVFTPNDATDASGRAPLALLPGTYNVEFNPPPGTTFDRVVLHDVPVIRDTTLVAQLPQVARVHVRGRILDPAGIGVAGATLRARRVPGDAVTSIPNPHTDAGGAFDLALPPATYDVEIAPMHGARLAGRRVLGLMVFTDSTLDDLRLEAAVLFTAHVSDVAGLPVAGADFDFTPAGGGDVLYTPHDNTDASGLALVALVPARYDVRVTPPEASGLQPALAEAFLVDADTSATFVLQGVGSNPGAAASFASLGPNPFGNELAIGVQLRAPAMVTLAVYDVAGRWVRTLEHGAWSPVAFTRIWNGTAAGGDPAPSGVYFVALRAGDVTATRKVLLVR